MDDNVQSCPAMQRFAIEAWVVGEDDSPLADIAVELRKNAGALLRGKTTPSGMVRFDGLEQGVYQLSLYKLDQDAWELAGEVALAKAASEGDAPWAEPEPVAAGAEITYTVMPGECASKIAYRFGFFVDTVWDWPANAVLKSARGDKYVLAPNDQLRIPALRRSSIDCRTGQRYTLRRKGVPERLDIQFALGGVPRADVAYYLSLTTLSGNILKDQTGRTTADGRVQAWVPPDTAEASIQLTQDGDTDEYVFAIGALDPADLDSGARARLASLGFFAGLENTPDSEHLADALRRFQQSEGLAQSGQLDTQTIARLGERYQQGQGAA